MADMISFELVSPERQLASQEAESVTVPGQAGDLTAMANHAPFLTTLRPGYVVVRGGSGEHKYFVSGGFVEIASNVVSVLAEEAVEADKADADYIGEHIKSAEQAHDTAGEDRKHIELQRLNDLKALL